MMLLYFRVRDREGASPKLRGYGKDMTEPMDSFCVDEVIAQEIRQQVNNWDNSDVFSYSKSLGVVLYKYNRIADNPIYITMNQGSFVDFTVLNYNGLSENYCVPYNIDCLNYPFRHDFKNQQIILNNYIIEVDDNYKINRYLQAYTPKGRSPYASCENDKEVIIRNPIDSYAIEEQDCIDAVYLLYALQVKTGFLGYSGVAESLNAVLSEELCVNRDDEETFRALECIIFYLQEFVVYEKEIITNLINKDKKARMGGWDSYSLLLEVINGDIDEAFTLSEYYIYSGIVSYIWDVFRSMNFV